MSLPSELPILRVARPTDRLEDVVKQYVSGLGFAILSRFENHDDFDGVILGRPGAPYHLEFTTRRGHVVGSAPTQDNLLVFYVPEAPAWRAACESMAAADFIAVPSFNPYWDRCGRTFEDCDGYRVVLQHEDWRS